MSCGRSCSQCLHELRPIKNGFYHLRRDGKAYTSDLWGCYGCGHFEIHGMPKQAMISWPIYAIVVGELSPDSEYPDIYDQVLDPDIRMAHGFERWMDLYYSDWRHPLPMLIPGPWDEFKEVSRSKCQK